MLRWQTLDTDESTPYSVTNKDEGHFNCFPSENALPSVLPKPI